MFPSLQTGAKSFNMAIKSDLVDQKFIDVEAAAIMRGYKIEKEIFFGWFLQCSRIFNNELKWEEPPRVSQISQNELEQFKKIINDNGTFSQNPKYII
jgi:hypothetical protein